MLILQSASKETQTKSKKVSLYLPEAAEDECTEESRVPGAQQVIHKWLSSGSANRCWRQVLGEDHPSQARRLKGMSGFEEADYQCLLLNLITKMKKRDSGSVSLAQVPSAGEWQNWDANPDLLCGNRTQKETGTETMRPGE